MAPPLSAALSTEEVCKPPRGVWSVQHSGLLILWSSLLLERWLRESAFTWTEVQPYDQSKCTVAGEPVAAQALSAYKLSRCVCNAMILCTVGKSLRPRQPHLDRCPGSILGGSTLCFFVNRCRGRRVLSGRVHQSDAAARAA